MKLSNFLASEIAIDLGTANTLIVHNNQVVVDEPSVIAKCRKSGKLIAVGKKAQLMDGRTHKDIKTIRPLRNGAIADFRTAEDMLRGLIKLFNPRRSLASSSHVMVSASRLELPRLSDAQFVRRLKKPEQKMYI